MMMGSRFFVSVMSIIILSTGIILYLPFTLPSTNSAIRGIISIAFAAYFSLNVSEQTQGSNLEEVVRYSSLLQLSHACVLAGVVPMALETILDFRLRVKEGVVRKRVVINLSHRITLLFLVIPSIVFLLFRTSEFMPGLYVVQFLTQNLVIPARLIIAAIPEVSPVSSIIVPYGLVITYALFSLRCIIEAYQLLLGVEFAYIEVAGTNVVAIMSYFIFYCCAMWWLYKKHLFQRENPSVRRKGMTDGEYQIFVYIAILVGSSTADIVANIFLHATTWLDVSEATLVTYTSIQFAINVFMIVLPGRVERMRAFANIEVSLMKEVFVRYISHEIRSPLNVVHAGIELLRETLLARFEDKTVLDLIADVYDSSVMAINILADLLSFENLDAGTFKLDLSWTPLLGIFERDLKVAEITNSARNINFQFCDYTVASAAGIRKQLEEPDITLLEEGIDWSSLMDRGENPFPDVPFADCSLHIDITKINELVRILITNAVGSTPTNGSVLVSMSCRLGSLPSLSQGEAKGVFRFAVTDGKPNGGSLQEFQRLLGDSSYFNKEELKGGGGREMGMWIARKIVSMHQGRLGAEEGEEGGSTLFFELPLYSAQVRTQMVEEKKPLRSLAPLRYGESRTMKLRGDVSFKSKASSDSDADASKADENPKLIGRFFPLSNSYSRIFPTNGEAARSQSASMLGPSPDQPHRPGDAASVRCSMEPASPGRQIQHQVRVQVQSASKNESVIDLVNDIEPIRILIVDDSELNRKIVRRILEGSGQFAGAVIREADDGQTAVEAMRAEAQNYHPNLPFDVVLMDYTMLEMDGPEAARIMRKEMHYTGIIIGVTGNALPADVSKFIESGANEVIIKPVTKTKLVECLVNWRV